jgi:predicted CXXCH cytochrome family protein
MADFSGEKQNMKNVKGALLCAAMVFSLAGTAFSGTCIEGGCHSDKVNYKYLHGPIATEEAGGKGCVSCHVPKGAACSASEGGVFELVASKDGLCFYCHEKDTGTEHSARTTGCLYCHSPHGSNTDPKLVRKK